MPTLAIGSLATLGLVTLAAVMAWKRAQARQFFASGGVLPEAGKDQSAGAGWQPTYTAGSTPVVVPQRVTGKAPYVLAQGRFVRGLEPNRRTQDGRIVPHWGIDISAPIGQPVFAVKDGTVTRAEPITGYGNAVVVRHDADGKSTLYAHLNRIATRVGAHVNGGAAIGEVGRTSAGADGVVPSWGATMGAHLHMEVHPGPTPVLTEQSRRLDPVAWLRSEGIEQYGQRWART